MPTTIIPSTFVRIGSYKHTDADEHALVFGIDMNTGVAIGTAYKVTKGLVVALVGTTSALGKDDSITGIVYNDGTVRLIVSEADLNASGSTSAGRVYDFPGAFPKAVSMSSSGADSFLRSAIRSFMIALRNAANIFLASGV